MLANAGFTPSDGGPGVRLKGSGMIVHDIVTDAAGGRWVIELGGPFLRYRGGLTSVDAVWRTLGRAHALRGLGERVLVLTSDLPKRRSEFDIALRAAGPEAVFDVIDVFDDEALARLRRYATGHSRAPASGPRLLEPPPDGSDIRCSGSRSTAPRSPGGELGADRGAGADGVDRVGA